MVEDCALATEYFLNLGFTLKKEIHESRDLGVKFCHLKVGSMMFELIQPTADLGSLKIGSYIQIGRASCRERV